MAVDIAPDGLIAAVIATAPCAACVSVADANVALQHNLGLGGACVVTLYQKV